MRKINIFVIMQPFQYLQTLELIEPDNENHLVLLGDLKINQLAEVIDKSLWTNVLHFNFNGSYIDIIKNRKRIKNFLLSHKGIKRVVISSQYNEFMNLICNYFSSSEIILLDDGMANLLSNHNLTQQPLKKFIKFILCRMFGFDVRRIFDVTLFTMFEQFYKDPPIIAKRVIINKFINLKKLVRNKFISEDVVFISSAFVSNNMLSYADYSSFIISLANENLASKFTVFLHRFDDISLFLDLNSHGIETIKLDIPIEAYFLHQSSLPKKVITSGSGATESLNLIFGIESEVKFPEITLFASSHREEIVTLKKYFDSKRYQ